jgi:hypothetical protein
VNDNVIGINSKRAKRNAELRALEWLQIHVDDLLERMQWQDLTPTLQQYSSRLADLRRRLEADIQLRTGNVTPEF